MVLNLPCLTATKQAYITITMEETMKLTKIIGRIYWLKPLPIIGIQLNNWTQAWIANGILLAVIVAIVVALV